MLGELNADIALLQEAAEPPQDLPIDISLVNPAPWLTAGGGVNRRWRTAIVRLSPRFSVDWIEVKPIAEALHDELPVSRLGTLTAAIVSAPNIEPVIVASIYAPWERSHKSTGSDWIYADASVHRLISDLSSLIGRQSGHRLVVAGDLNILHGYGEWGSSYWEQRYATVFSRMAALGLDFVGPQAPNGRMAAPWPTELPPHSQNVPTITLRGRIHPPQPGNLISFSLRGVSSNQFKLGPSMIRTSGVQATTAEWR